MKYDYFNMKSVLIDCHQTQYPEHDFSKMKKKSSHEYFNVYMKQKQNNKVNDYNFLFGGLRKIKTGNKSCQYSKINQNNQTQSQINKLQKNHRKVKTQRKNTQKSKNEIQIKKNKIMQSKKRSNTQFLTEHTFETSRTQQTKSGSKKVIIINKNKRTQHKLIPSIVSNTTKINELQQQQWQNLKNNQYTRQISHKNQKQKTKLQINKNNNNNQIKPTDFLDVFLNIPQFKHISSYKELFSQIEKPIKQTKNIKQNETQNKLRIKSKSTNKLKMKQSLEQINRSEIMLQKDLKIDYKRLKLLQQSLQKWANYFSKVKTISQDYIPQDESRYQLNYKQWLQQALNYEEKRGNLNSNHRMKKILKYQPNKKKYKFPFTNKQLQRIYVQQIQEIYGIQKSKEIIQSRMKFLQQPKTLLDLKGRYQHKLRSYPPRHYGGMSLADKLKRLHE